MIYGVLSYLTCFGWLPLFLMGLLGLILGFLLSRLFGKSHAGDLSIEGEGALRAEANGLRARVQELEGSVSTRDGEVSDLKGKLAAAAAGAAVATAATAKSGGDDDSYALEWRNRYLAARVKYLEGRLSDAPAPAKKKAAPKAKAAPKKKAAPKAKAAPKPKVLYTDGPTDGAPDDLKLIKGIGPKFEKDLNSKGIYYFRQIGAWKAADVKMVEGIIDSIPGRIKRDEWVKQAKGLAKGAAPRAMKSSKKPGPKTGTKRGALTQDGRARQKPGPKSGAARKPAKSAAEKKFDKYYTNVQKFDKGADADTVRNIIKYCGPALNTRDASLVACSDEAEVNRVAKGFITKKLKLSSGQLELAKDVCTQMKPVRFKDRVTFYYLAAQKAGKLDMFK
ncbi:MAG: DUF2853 family protein [Maricaulaceae bacterium]